MSALRAKLARLADKFESGMILRREEKCEVPLGQGTGGLGRRQIDADSQRLEHISATGLAGNRAITMFGYRNSRGGANEGHRGRDVERIEFIAASAANIEYDIGREP